MTTEPKTGTHTAGKSVLFLDVDGVLNSTEWFQGRRDSRPGKIITPEQHEETMIDPAAVARLDRIIRETGCDVVISSTWRRFYTVGQFTRLMVKFGMSKEHWDNFIGKTPVLDGPRGHEIQAWLANNKGYDRIAILDDDADMVHLKPKLVWCHGCEGLTDKKAEEVIERLAALALISPEERSES